MLDPFVVTFQRATGFANVAYLEIVIEYPKLGRGQFRHSIHVSQSNPIVSLDLQETGVAFSPDTILLCCFPPE